MMQGTGKGLENLGRELLDRVETGIKEFTRQSRSEMDEARVQAYLGLKELESYWQEKRGDLNRMLDELRGGEAWTAEKLDALRVKWHLGAMDAREALQDLKGRLERSETLVEGMGSDGLAYLKGLRRDLKELKNRLAKH
jgi:hypothetical protein